MGVAIAWKPSYSVGEPSLDDQHKQIIAIINDLYLALDAGHDQAALKSLLNRLVQYTDRHFKDEERMMEMHAYPRLLEHENLHARLRKRTVDLRAHTDLITGRDLLNFLKLWWVEHIQDADKDYAPYLDVPSLS